MKAENATSSAKRDQILTNIQLDILAEEMDGTIITLSKLEEILSQYGTVQYDNDGNITGIYVSDLGDTIDIADIYTGDITDGITDYTVPTATISLSATSAIAGTSVTAIVTQTDNDSGVDVSSSKYIYTTTSEELGTTNSSWDSATSFTSNPQTLSLSASSTDTYYLHVLTVDYVGNMAEVVSEGIIVEVLMADGSFSTVKGVNTPNLGTGMTAIKWNGSSWVKTTGDDSEWYEYSTTEKKWANAVLNGTFNTDGTLDESGTGYAMFVWIPRYAYQIADNYHSGGEDVSGTINIKFMKGTTNEAADGTTSWDNASGEGNWNIHPGFEYSSTVAGIWVAKFEASSVEGNSNSDSGDNVTTKTLQIKADVQSWRYINVNNIYTVCLNYNTALNSHMMKNSEWGAVAYLTQSVYGKNSEVWINPNSNYITGQAGTSVSASSTTETYNYTDTTYGVNASTSGNVYGVYDMSGGAWEYVAAYVNNGNSELTTYGSSIVNGASYTKDVYSMGSEDTQELNYEANAGTYGDALYETSSGFEDTTAWYYDLSHYAGGHSDESHKTAFFNRGCKYDYRRKRRNLCI